MHRLIIVSVGYATAFHFAYVVFLYPVFEYAHFYYFPPSLPLLILTYSLAIAPVVGLRESTLPAFCGAALVFVICYVPAQLTLLFTWQRETEELVIVQAALARKGSVGAHFRSDFKERGENWQQHFVWDRNSVVISADDSHASNKKRCNR